MGNMAVYASISRTVHTTFVDFAFTPKGNM